MIDDFKLGMRVLKYGLNVKVAFAGAAILLVLGILMEFVAPTMPSNGLYMGMGGMMVFQTIGSVSVSTMVQNSPQKKRLQTSVPAIMGCAYMLIVNTLFLFIKWIASLVPIWEIFEVSFAEMSFKIIFDALFMVIMVLYNAVALKMFWLSTVIFFIVYLSSYLSVSNRIFSMEAQFAMPVVPAIGISYLIILVGTLLIYGILVLLYKKPYCKMAFESLLKRAK